MLVVIEIFLGDSEMLPCQEKMGGVLVIDFLLLNCLVVETMMY